MKIKTESHNDNKDRPMLLRACHTAGMVLNVICASGGLMPTYPRSRNCSHSLLWNMALTPTAPIFIRFAVPTCKSPSWLELLTTDFPSQKEGWRRSPDPLWAASCSFQPFKHRSSLAEHGLEVFGAVRVYLWKGLNLCSYGNASIHAGEVFPGGLLWCYPSSCQ